MEKRSIIHMFDPMPHNSPFDINMAMDAGFDILMPYCNVKLENINALTQDTIFSRGAAGVKRTAIFIGGRDLLLAIEMLEVCKRAMVSPFDISVFTDPSGAFTTAAALVACVEQQLLIHHAAQLKDQKVVIFGGTGPVGSATGIIASLAGAQTILVDHLSLDNAEEVAKTYNRRFSANLQGACARNDEEKMTLLATADVVLSTAKAGVQVLNAAVLKNLTQVKVAGDVNAVPPLGIEGIKRKDAGEPLLYAVNAAGAVGVGALAVGDVKYQLQHKLLQLLLTTEQPVYLDFRIAFEQAREILR
jgi:methylene-tetrahydromethanopterin dehydrogenase